jgi:hypothetical protein
MDSENRESVYTRPQRERVWLREEQRSAVVRRVESHPNHGKQYLVTTTSGDWGPETYWVKESNVDQIGHGRWSGNGRE